MMKCPECGCQFREQEGKVEDESPEHEAGESKDYESGEMDEGDMDEIEGEVPGKVSIKKVEVPSGKEDLIKKKLMELGKMLASIK